MIKVQFFKDSGKGDEMEDITRVVVDAMGGDNAPKAPVQAAVDAVNERKDIHVILVGQKEKINRELKNYGPYPADCLQVVDAREVIETAEMPTKAIMEKRDSSIVKGLRLVKSGEADAFVSSGNSGAVMVGGTAIIRKLRGVERAPLAPLLPTSKGVSLLVDCGANVDARPTHLVQFARMGSIYMENIMGIKNPKVAIVNIGAEEEKGNALVKETFPLLKECKDINFIGSIESREILTGYADVIVCEAFTGNVILKLIEGVAKTLVHELKGSIYGSLRTKIGGLLVKPAMKETFAKLDSSEHGGAPLLGLNGLVVKTHGSANAKEIKNGIFQCADFKKQKINEIIDKKLNGES